MSKISVLTKETREAVRYVSLFAVLTLATAAATAAPVKVIFDTDMDSDVDDVGALAVLHALADLGEAEILAVIHSAPKPDGPVCAQAINAWYGRESIPVGWTDWPNFAESPVYAHYRRAQAAVKRLGSDYVPTIAAEHREARNGTTPPIHEGASLYRKTLAAAEDGSVVVCVVGQLSSLARLMESGPDEYSPLDGPALVARKTKSLVSMALSRVPDIQDGFNWDCDLPSAKTVINNWPTRLVVMPLGESILTGGPLVATGAPENPCRRAYDIYVKAPHKSRSSWDLCAVLYAVRGPHPWFREITGFRVHLDPETGASAWQEDASSQHISIEQALSDESIRDVLDGLMLRHPQRAN